MKSINNLPPYIRDIIAKKKAHIILIILGSIFILLGAFHTNLWFDEAYTVGLVNHSFIEIWQITGNDVHPPLYYWMLKIVSLLFGSSILAYRLFSAIAIILLAVLGYTHVRKSFGERIGFIFSFLVLFLPSMTAYAQEIRMYSWAMLFTTLVAIYAYQISKENKKRYWIIFSIFSLASAYTHYYGLLASGMINLVLFIYILKYKKDLLKPFVISGIAQSLIYTPWLMYFISQVREVSGGFWIGVEFPGTLIQILNTQFIGNFRGNLINYIILVLVVCLYTYTGYLVSKEKKEKNSNARIPIVAIWIYISIIFVATIISLVMGTSILYHRYLMAITGLLIFFLSYFMGKERRFYLILLISSLIMAVSTISNVIGIRENYNYRNQNPIQHLRENILEEDVIIFSTHNVHGLAMSVHFLDNSQYFYDSDNWNVAEAYRAFGPQMSFKSSLCFLEQHAGRIWLVDNNKFRLYEEIDSTIERVNKISAERFEIAYKNQVYYLVLIEI